MLKIGLFDEEFRHLTNYCGYDQSREMQWVKDSYEPDILVFTDRAYDKVFQCPTGKIKCAMPLEPRVIHSFAYENLEKAHKHFDYVLTYEERLTQWLKQNSKTIPLWWTPGGSWVWAQHWGMYPKSKNVSIVAGMKDWTEGHRLRHSVIHEFENQFDLIAGYGRNPVEPKMEIFKDYRYSVVIENCRTNWYWTDKLLDCFACGTIPIFWGCPDIGKYFDLRAIMTFQTLDELGNVLKMIEKDGEHIYSTMLSYAMLNFEKAKRYMIPEDEMYRSIFKPLIESKEQ